MMHSTRGAFAGWLMVAVVFSGDAQAQTVTSNQPVAAAFGNLGTVISPGERVVLTTTDGTTLRGRFEGLGASGLLMWTGDRIRAFSDAEPPMVPGANRG